jgi:O-antigen/teichoic acid export membrane protein
MPGPAGSLRALARSGGAVAAARIFDLGASYVFYIVLARAAGVQEFGTLVLAMSVVQTAGVFTRLGLETASDASS